MRRFFLPMILISLLGGCANCNMLSSNNDLGCNALLAGGMVLAAPVVAPAALISDAGSDAKSRRMLSEWRADMVQKLPQNDPETIRRCLRECDTFWRHELSQQDRETFKREAAQRYLDGGWQQTPEEDRQAYRLLAHYMLSWLPAPTGNPEKMAYRLNPEHVRQSHALLKDEAVRTRMAALINYHEAGAVEDRIYSMAYAIDTSADDDVARTQFKGCLANLSVLAYGDPDHYTNALCERAYRYRFHGFPSELRDAWHQEFLQKRAEREAGRLRR